MTVATFIPETADAQETVHTLEQALWHLSQMRYVGELTVHPREEEDWANAWKEHFHVHRVGVQSSSARRGAATRRSRTIR